MPTRARARWRPNPEFLSVMHANYPPGTKLLMGCQMGGRSAQAAQILAAAGYQNVSNVRGGVAVRGIAARVS